MVETYYIDETMKKIDYIIRWIGLPLKKKEGLLSKLHLTYIINVICFNSDVLAAIGWFIAGAKRGESFTSLTYVAPCITMSMVTNVKTLSLFIHKERVKNIICTLRQLEDKEKMRPRSEEKLNIINKEMSFLNFVLKSLNCLNWSMIISFPMMPICLMVLDYLETNEFIPLMPCPVVYPFDTSSLVVWSIIYLKQAWSITVSILSLGGCDFFFYICTTLIRIQFQLLAYDFERLPIETNFPQNSHENQQFKEFFLDLITWHQQLIHCVQVLEVIFSKPTLINFVVGSAVICLCGFNVTTIKDVAFVITFSSFLLMTMFQIFCLCFFGDMLMTSSVDVSVAVYNSKWYLADQKTAKMLLLVLTRAQRACKLTACGFAEVNLPAFTTVLSTAWSYFALLKTVYTD